MKKGGDNNATIQKVKGGDDIKRHKTSRDGRLSKH